MTKLGYHALIAAIGVPLGLVVAVVIDMAEDNTKPYWREWGAIVAGPPEDCNLPASTATPNIVPEHCVVTVYYKHDIRSCIPVPGGHVYRTITKNGETRELPKLASAYAGPSGDTPSPLRRAWVYPKWGGHWDEPGQAIYSSEACYICPYGPIANQWHKYVSPVCVADSKLEYTVSAQ